MDRTRLPEATADSTGGMVSSAHYLASQAGVWMLQQGGNAVDAAVCAATTIAVVAPHMNGPGGDLFAQVWSPEMARPIGLNASGRSGSDMSIDVLRSRGHTMMPARGPLTINVPGIVSGWRELLERFGSRRLFDVLEPAVDYAEHGVPVTRRMAEALRGNADLIHSDPGMARVFTKSGKTLEEGSYFINRDLADSLREIGRTDGESYYRGELARRMVSGIAQAGGVLTTGDFAQHQAEWVEPLDASLLERSIFELPPNTQGITALELFNLVQESEALNFGHNSPEYISELVRCVRYAYEDRDTWISDPDFVDVPVSRLISRQYAKDRLAVPAGSPTSGADGDTIYLCVVDSAGMAVSLIQSHYMGFGSGVMASGTGIHFHNRGSYFSLDETHVNRLEPRKRTMHTLIPGLAFDGQDLDLVFGTMGGDAQPQIQLQVLLNHLHFGMGIQEAIEAARFSFVPAADSPNRILVESRIPEATLDKLHESGFDVIKVEEWSSFMGHAQAIRLDSASGLLHGAADPRGDGAALGY